MTTKSLGYNVTATDKSAATWLKIAQSLDQIVKRLDRLDGKRARVTVDADTGGAHKKIQTLDKSFGAATIRIAALGRAMGALALPGAIVAATPAIASLGSSAVTASGALWLLPAAATAGGIAMAALKVGMAGFGEAMKNMGDPAKFAEAIAKLSPAARDAATTVRALVPAWTAMQQVVQQNLFAGVAAQIGALAGIYLPMLTTGLGSVAGSLNAAGIGLANWARQGAVIGSIQTIFTNVGLAMQALAPTAAHIAAIFTDIAMVGSGFLPGLATGFAGATASAAAFIAQARQTGQLAVWIQNGLAVLRQLGELTGNVGSILGSVFGAAARSGESFLSMLVRVTGTMAAALKTPEGAAGLQEFFTTTRMVVGLLWDKLVQLWPAVVAGAGAFAALLQAAAPLTDVVFQLVVAGLVPLLDLIKFLAPVLGPLAAAFFLISTAMSVWSAVTRAASAVMKVWTAVQWLLNAALAANPIGLVVIAIAALVAGLIWAWHSSETFRAIVTAAFQAIAAAGMWMWNNVLRPAFTALSGFVTGVLGPAVMWLWKNIFEPAFNAIGSVIAFWWNNVTWPILKAAWAFIRDIVAPVVMWLWKNIFEPAFHAIGTVISFWWNNVVWPALQAAWAFIRDVVAPVVMWLWKNIFEPAFHAIGTVISFFWNNVAWPALKALWAFIRDVLVPVIMWLWKNIVEPAFHAIGAVIMFVWEQIIRPGFQALSRGIDAVGRTFETLRGIADRVWQGVKAAFVGAVNWIIDKINVFAGAINKVAGLLGFQIDIRLDRLALGGEIEAVRRQLGGTIEHKQVIRRATGGGVDATGGGRLPYTGTRRDTLPARAGAKPYLLQGEEWIIKRDSARSLGPAKMAAINNHSRSPIDIVPAGERERMAYYASGGQVEPTRMASAGEIARAASTLVPGSRMSSGFRRGDPGMHGRNQAADMTGNLGAINRAWAQRYGPSTDQLIYTPGINLLGGRGHTYNAATRADHYDHVHIGYSGQLGLPGGGFFNPSEGGMLLQLIRPIADSLLGPLRNILTPIRDDPRQNYGMRAGAGFGLKILDNLFAKASERDAAAASSGGMDVSGITGPVVEQVRQVAHRYGWGAGPQWDALARLIQKESGWNPNAANPRSSARGLFQKMTSIHGPVEPTAAGQAAWGLNYIRGRYRDPIGALGFHNRNNYYDRGGVASGRGIMWKETLRPERVLDPDMTRTFERFTDWLGSTTARQLLSTQTAGRRGGVTVNVDSAELVAELVKLRADVKAMQGGGATIHVEDRSGNPTETARAAQLALRLAR